MELVLLLTGHIRSLAAWMQRTSQLNLAAAQVAEEKTIQRMSVLGSSNSVLGAAGASDDAAPGLPRGWPDCKWPYLLVVIEVEDSRAGLLILQVATCANAGLQSTGAKLVVSFRPRLKDAAASAQAC